MKYIFFIVIILCIASLLFSNDSLLIKQQPDNINENYDEFYDINTTDEKEQFSKQNIDTAIDFQNIWIINSYVVFFSILASILGRYRKLIKYRSLFLLLSLTYLGFYNGGCPCMISSFQNLIIFITGEKVLFELFVWFLLLIPITYLLGKSWCGWVCHLGALQEFLYNRKYGNLFISDKSQRIFRILRIFFLVVLILQVIFTSDLFWCRIDPFKSVFNLYIGNYLKPLNITLVVLLIIFSVFSYRPFCRGFCPVGLILALISYIPYASILTFRQDRCNNCLLCEKECKLAAIESDEKITVLNNLDCIGCNECLNSCSKCEIVYTRKKYKL
ncbi:MAG: 4Fe-4S binding protein [Bacteroidales bacterium]|nr:4Fe-4S binding protein [Bacteroidales bacterium]